MADLTLTSTRVNNGPILGDLTGLNVAYAHMQAGPDLAVSLSGSAVLQMIAVPDGARIVDVITRVTGIGAQVGNYAVGDGSATARYVTSISITSSTVLSYMNAAGGAGFRYSLTQSDFVQYDTIDIYFHAITSTRTLCVDMTVYYLMDR